jgi:hypothetical protein
MPLSRDEKIITSVEIEMEKRKIGEKPFLIFFKKGFEA